MSNDYIDEQALLGLWLSDPRHIDDSTDFEIANLHLDSYRRVANLMRQMHSLSQEVSLITFQAELERKGMIDAVGGIGYVAGLTDNVWRGKNDTAEYIRSIRERASLRRIELLCAATMAKVRDGNCANEILYGLQSAANLVQSSSARVRPLPNFRICRAHMGSDAAADDSGT